MKVCLTNAVICDIPSYTSVKANASETAIITNIFCTEKNSLNNQHCLYGFYDSARAMLHRAHADEMPTSLPQSVTLEKHTFQCLFNDASAQKECLFTGHNLRAMKYELSAVLKNEHKKSNQSWNLFLELCKSIHQICHT